MTNKPIYKIVVGAFFVAAGIYGYFAKQEMPMLQVLALVIGAYGVYNIGWGVYLKKKEKGEFE